MLAVCGFNFGKITNNYNTGVVTGTGDSVGGVCGLNSSLFAGFIAYRGIITNSYNIGMVNGSGNFVGGVCGDNSETIENSYFNSDIYAGSAIGLNDDGTVDENTVLGKTTAQFANGEVASLLHQGCTVDGTFYDGSVWEQNVLTAPKDEIPVLNFDMSETTTVQTGDANCDNAISIADEFETLMYNSKHSAGDDDYTFQNDADLETEILNAVDIDADGEITIGDAYLILMYTSYHSAGTDITWEELLKLN